MAPPKKPLVRAYKPTPGSVPWRAIAFLESLPEGAEVTSAELAAATGCSAHRALFPCLARAVMLRRVFRRRAGGNAHKTSPVLWSLLERPAPAPEAEPEVEDSELESTPFYAPIIRRVVPAASAPRLPVAERGPASVFTWRPSS